MNYFSYALTPLIAWFCAGILKFLINSFKTKHFAFGLIGYGGLPSNHSAIVSSIAALIAAKDGINNPAFGVAITLAFIVILDASSLRREVGRHAVAINKSQGLSTNNPLYLREHMGHTRLEILSGVIVGVLVGYFVFYFS